jgi:hypothetical protein
MKKVEAKAEVNNLLNLNLNLNLLYLVEVIFG